MLILCRFIIKKRNNNVRLIIFYTFKIQIFHQRRNIPLVHSKPINMYCQPSILRVLDDGKRKV